MELSLPTVSHNNSVGRGGESLSVGSNHKFRRYPEIGDSPIGNLKSLVSLPAPSSRYKLEPLHQGDFVTRSKERWASRNDHYDRLISQQHKVLEQLVIAETNRAVMQYRLSRTRLVKAAIKIQSFWRGCMSRQRVQHLREGVFKRIQRAAFIISNTRRMVRRFRQRRDAAAAFEQALRKAQEQEERERRELAEKRARYEQQLKAQEQEEAEMAQRQKEYAERKLEEQKHRKEEEEEKHAVAARNMARKFVRHHRHHKHHHHHHHHHREGGDTKKHTSSS